MPSTPPKGINNPNPPPLPGVGVPQPSPIERATIEDTWKALKDAPAALADIILIINAHPELIEWAKASKAGVLRVK